MAVRIRMKKLGRRHRPFFRICAIDARAPRDGKVIEELGYYDPLAKETDARAVLKAERIDYWLGVGAQPSDKVKVLIKKYGTAGTHLEQQQAAIERLSIKPTAPPPVAIPVKKKEEATPAEEAKPAAGTATAEAPSAEESAASESAESAAESTTEEKSEASE